MYRLFAELWCFDYVEFLNNGFIDIHLVEWGYYFAAIYGLFEIGTNKVNYLLWSHMFVKMVYGQYKKFRKLKKIINTQIPLSRNCQMLTFGK